MERATRKWVLITGASSGIGEACAAALISRSFSVLAGVRKRQDGERLRRAHGAALVPVSLDVTRPGSVRAAVTLARRRCGARGLYGLVNNAGVTFCAPLELTPLDALRALLEVNVTGVLAVTQALLPALRASGGRIVNVGSLSGVVAAPFIGAYCASKFALEGLSDSLRMELSPWNIGVTLVQPGPTATPIWEKSEASTGALRRRVPSAARALYQDSWARADEVLREAAARAVPPEAVAEAVAEALLASPPPGRVPLNDGGTRALRAMSDAVRDEAILRGWGLPTRAPSPRNDGFVRERVGVRGLPHQPTGRG